MIYLGPMLNNNDFVFSPSCLFDGKLMLIPYVDSWVGALVMITIWGYLEYIRAPNKRCNDR